MSFAQLSLFQPRSRGSPLSPGLFVSPRAGTELAAMLLLLPEPGRLRALFAPHQVCTNCRRVQTMSPSLLAESSSGKLNWLSWARDQFLCRCRAFEMQNLPGSSQIAPQTAGTVTINIHPRHPLRNRILSAEDRGQAGGLGRGAEDPPSRLVMAFCWSEQPKEREDGLEGV